jgi:hypothetical protein
VAATKRTATVTAQAVVMSFSVVLPLKILFHWRPNSPPILAAFPTMADLLSFKHRASPAARKAS